MTLTLHSRRALAGAAICLALIAAGNAEDKPKNDPGNKITAYITPGASEREAVVTVWMANVNPVGAICLPLKFAAPDSVHLDSLVTKPYRAGAFMMPPPKYEADKQTLLCNMLRHADSVKAKTGLIPPGEGVLATIHFSAKGKFPLEGFKIAAVQLPPENVLMYVTDTFNSVLPEYEAVRQAPPGAKDTGAKTP